MGFMESSSGLGETSVVAIPTGREKWMLKSSSHLNQNRERIADLPLRVGNSPLI